LFAYVGSNVFLNKMKALITTVVAGTLVLGFAQCRKDQALLVNPNVDCSTISVSYSADIVPIIETSCATGAGAGSGCHDSWILTYDGLKTKIDNGKFEMRVISQQDMPLIPNTFGIDSLTADEFAKIQCWLADGYPEN
jgi:hypothetical protein